MPVCFQLFKLGADEPEKLGAVDDAMRAYFQDDADPDHYYASWYDTIGFSLALGKSWDDIAILFPERADIVQWMRDNYSPSAWRERRHT